MSSKTVALKDEMDFTQSTYQYSQQSSEDLG